MTPLEELQAAHDRLTELAGEYVSFESVRKNDDSSLEYTPLGPILHRTIKAQLMILENAMLGVTKHEVVALYPLMLAKAINGEA